MIRLYKVFLNMEYKNVKFFQTRNIRMFETVKKSHLLVFNN